MKDLQAKNIFHEIKNQISVCDLYTEVIKRALEKKGIEDETLNLAIQNIKTSLEIIGSSTSKLKDSTLSETSLKELVSSAFEICKTYGSVKLISEINPKATVKVNRHKFVSALTNIIKNAIEAGADEVKISNNSKNIYITNNGEVIPQEVQSKIFSDGFTTKETGNGLGLMLTQQNLAEQGFGLRLEQSGENLTIFNIYKL